MATHIMSQFVNKGVISGRAVVSYNAKCPCLKRRVQSSHQMSNSTQFGIIDKETFTEYTEEVRRTFVLPPVDNDGQPFFNDSIELVGETGVSLTNADDAEVLLSYSDDGGRTFSDNITESFGALGEYGTRAIWTELGRSARERMYRFSVSAPVKWAFSKVEVNIE